MPVRVTILGTSNSVMTHGYVVGLGQTDGIDIVANTSVGSSHSVMVPLMADDEALSNSDFVIVDLTINEQRALHRRLYNLATMRDIFLYILGKCRTNDVIPVFLFMPMRLYENSYEIISIYKALCEQYGVLFFDPESRIKAEAARSKRAWPDMFEDQHHLTPEVAQWVGRELGEALKSADTTVGGDMPVECPGFDYVAAAPFAGTLPVIERSTQLVSATLVRMMPGDRLAMPVPPGSAVVGLALNMGGTNANLRLSGQTQIVKRLNQPYFNPRSPLRLVVWQLITPILASEAGLELTCEADRANAAVESNDHFAARTAFAPRPHVELAGLILRASEPATRTMWPRFARPDLAIG